MITDKCPICKKELTFKTVSGHYKFVKYHRQCRSCSKTKPSHPQEDFIRFCSRCGTPKVYKTISEKNRADRKHQQCKSCAAILHNGMKGKHHSKETIEKYFKGEKNPQFGKPLSDQTKEKLRNKLSGENNPFYGKKHTDDILRKNVEVNSGINSFWYGRKHSENTKIKMRCSMIQRLKDLGFHYRGNFNKVACEYFDKLNKQNGWSLQHAMNGGEIDVLGYWVDGYDKDKNIIVEYDEPKHYDCFGNLRPKDVKRMSRIINQTGCKFFRYNERTKTLTEHFSS
jgi:hypothetical protein